MRTTFTTEHRDGLARTGEVTTARGTFTTPCFMPVGTRGAIKHLSSADLEELGAQVILANTYHLHLRPGEATVRDLGGADIPADMPLDHRLVLVDGGLALGPGREARRGQQVVQRNGERHALLRGEEGLEDQHAELLERRLLDAADQVSEPEALPVAPRAGGASGRGRPTSRWTGRQSTRARRHPAGAPGPTRRRWAGASKAPRRGRPRARGGVSPRSGACGPRGGRGWPPRGCRWSGARAAGCGSRGRRAGRCAGRALR